MTDAQRNRNRAFMWTGLGAALMVAIFLSPFASRNPDGLDRVSQDHQFDKKAAENTPAKNLPFHSVFEEYSVRNVPANVATPLAGLVGTLVTFGLAYGIGKLVVRRPGSPPDDPA